MFVSKRLIYIQLRKTGSTHIARLLSEIVGGEQIGKHNRLPDNLGSDGRFIIGSIRNPWDWYVSLWSFGCDGKGGLFQHLTSPPGLRIHGFERYPIYALFNLVRQLRKSPEKWLDTYKSSDDPERFRRWLHMIHNPKNRHYLGGDYGRSPISLFSGFFTYRYAYLYSREPEKLYSGSIVTHRDLQAFIEENTVLNFTIRSEHLEDDLIEALGKGGIELNKEQLSLIYSAKRSNISSRKRQLSYYYDRETIELVKMREKAIIDKYNYIAPTLIEQGSSSPLSQK